MIQINFSNRLFLYPVLGTEIVSLTSSLLGYTQIAGVQSLVTRNITERYIFEAMAVHRSEYIDSPIGSEMDVPTGGDQATSPDGVYRETLYISDVNSTAYMLFRA